MTDHKHALLSRLANRSARVAVVGLGYVGLPLAATLAEAGFTVTGIDTDPRKVEDINLGISHVGDVTTERLGVLTRSGRLSTTGDFGSLRDCDAVSICVPTPLSKIGDPDMSYIAGVAEAAVPHLRAGILVVLESTTYPGTTRDLVLPILASAESDLVVGESLFLAFAPERVDPGRTDWTTENTPRVIGGITPACLEVAVAYYGQFVPHLVPVSSTEAAEMAKLLENTFRAVNIGLANEVLHMCDHLGLDAWEVIEAAATKPFGFMKFTPGPGIGGHCIPIDPLYLSWRLRQVRYTARFIDLARDINASMPAYWVQRVQDALNAIRKSINGSRILVLGVTYKRDVADMRESPAIDIISLLSDKGANVEYHDPFVPAFQQDSVEMVSVSDLDCAVAGADCVVLVTDHSAYQRSYLCPRASAWVDTRQGTSTLACEPGPHSDYQAPRVRGE